MTIRSYLSWFRRRWFGGYLIDDPRPIAEEAPYTFHLPSENEQLALAPGDLVKLIVRSHPAGKEWEAERMWVAVTVASGERLEGTLENQPSDMPQLRPGSPIIFRRQDVIDIDWADERAMPPPPAPQRRWYWERCLVDLCVTEEGIAVEYLYREHPDLGQADDRFPDSGWRIRGDSRGISDEALEEREAEYVALGRVLNADDSWLSLVDQPVGSAFMRNWATGQYDPCENQTSEL